MDTLDGYFGYRFISRDETADEYRARTGSAAGAGALVPSDTYQLVAGFGEHDVKFGGSATTEVPSETVLARDEAQRLAESAVAAETERALGPGDWRLSLSSLDMGVGFSPQVLTGATWRQTAVSLHHPPSAIARSVDGAANYLTAAICAVTGNQPSSACTPVVRALERNLS